MGKTKRKAKVKPAEQQVAEQIQPETRAHWVSREMERFIAPVITAVILSGLYFFWDYVTTDPEHAETIRSVKQHDELIGLLSESVAQQSASIKSLASDRAGTVYGGASRAMETLEEKNRGIPFSAWDVEDRTTYDAAKAQRADAAKRLGIQPGNPL